MTNKLINSLTSIFSDLSVLSPDNFENATKIFVHSLDLGNKTLIVPAETMAQFMSQFANIERGEILTAMCYGGHNETVKSPQQLINIAGNKCQRSSQLIRINLDEKYYYCSGHTIFNEEAPIIAPVYEFNRLDKRITPILYIDYLVFTVKSKLNTFIRNTMIPFYAANFLYCNIYSGYRKVRIEVRDLRTMYRIPKIPRGNDIWDLSTYARNILINAFPIDED
jgi:hypothetical protein